MQQKLEDFCEQMNSAKDQPMNYVNKISQQCDQYSVDGMPKGKGAEFSSCGDPIHQLKPDSGIAPVSGNLSDWPKDTNGMESGKDDIFKTSRVNLGEQEERRMSDLSDFSSFTSSVDIQLCALAAQQDFYNHRKECEEKDATIKELTAAVHASSFASSKRVMELEEVARRKNMIITKLKKDMVVLEQKVVQLTRLRRPSTASEMDTTKLPVIVNNLLYDMSSTSPSSSDSDTPVEHREQQPLVSVECDGPQGYRTPSIKSQSQASARSLVSSNRLTNRPQKQRTMSPAKENFITHHRADSAVAFRLKRLVSCNGEPKKRHAQQESNCSAPHKRRV